MLEGLLKLVEQNAQKTIVENKSIPDQFNNAAIKEVTNQIIDQLKGQVTQGNIQEIVTMFHANKGKNIGSNPMISNIITSVSASLTSKFGISNDIARSVADNLVPSVINDVIKKANDPRDIEFDLQQMIRGMAGNPTLDISGMTDQVSKGGLGNVFNKLFGK